MTQNVELRVKKLQGSQCEQVEAKTKWPGGNIEADNGELLTFIHSDGKYKASDFHVKFFKASDNTVYWPFTGSAPTDQTLIVKDNQNQTKSLRPDFVTCKYEVAMPDTTVHPLDPIIIVRQTLRLPLSPVLAGLVGVAIGVAGTFVALSVF